MKEHNLDSLNPGDFINLTKDREAAIEDARPELKKYDYPANALAKSLHPKCQHLSVAEVTEHFENCKSYTLVPDKERGTACCACFSAGQYLSVAVSIDGVTHRRPYSIVSSPGEASLGRYRITVKGTADGFVSSYILNNWKKGTKVDVSDPMGEFTYEPLRDAPFVVGIAGGSGITPFMSLAGAVAEGDEDVDLTLFYGNRDEGHILFKDELDRIADECPKVKVVYVLEDASPKDSENVLMTEKGPKDGETVLMTENGPIDGRTAGGSRKFTEYGFITADLIKKYSPGTTCSYFICGPRAMVSFADEELKKLNLTRRFIRHELHGEPQPKDICRGHAVDSADDPRGAVSLPEADDRMVTITVLLRSEIMVANGRTRDSVLRILEKNGITPPTRCRSGECGFCRARLISGEVTVPAGLDVRRMADRKYGYIHPCCAYPLGDLRIEINADR